MPESSDTDHFIDGVGLFNDVSSQVDDGENVLLLGRAGIGKTRLAFELCAQAEKSGRRVDRIMASTAMAGFNFGALRSISISEVAAGGDLPMLFGRYLDRWRSMQHQDTPMLVWLDDTQHLDEMTAALLRQAVSLDAIQLIATHRVPELLPTEIGALLDQGLLRAIDVPPLRRSDSEKLADQSAGRKLDQDRLNEIWRLTDGYPLFVRNLAQASRGSDGAVTSFETAIARRFQDLSGPQRTTAELIALAQPVRLEMLGNYRDQVEGLMAKGLVRRHDDITVRMDHPLYAQWLIESARPRSTELFAILAKNAPRANVDPVTQADLVLRSNQIPNYHLATQAARLAIARSDTTSAQRFLDHVGDDVHDLLRAMILLHDNEVDHGLGLLERVTNAPSSAEIRVEAASLLARFVGLTMDDRERAHSILQAADRDALAPPLRRQLLLGRLWLWMFGAGDRSDARGHVERLLDERLPVDPTSFEVAYTGVGVLYQNAGIEPMQKLIERMHAIENQIDAEPEAVSRARAIEAWHVAFCGDIPKGLKILAQRLTEPEAQLSAHGMSVLGGTTGYLSALAGKIQDSLIYAKTGVEAARPLDWYRMGELARYVELGNQALAGTWDRSQASLMPETEALDLEVMFATRARALLAEATGGKRNDQDELHTLRLLRKNEKYAWLAVFAPELFDLRSDSQIHQFIVATLDRFGDDGIFPIAVLAARGRLNGSSTSLIRAASQFEQAGIPAASARCFADAARLDADSAVAIQGIVRAQLRWDGAPMPWLSDISNIPTRRQLEVARIALDGDIADAANKLHISKRTVENHLYRVYKKLGVSNLEELGVALEMEPDPPSLHA